MKIIIVASSPIKTFQKLYHLNPSDYFIGLDGGCEELIKRNIIPDIAIGDFDSTEQLEMIQKKALETVVFPSQKNETDLELALMHITHIQGAKDIIIEVYDALSGRLDHELLAIYLLQKYHEYKIKLIDEKNSIQLVREKETIVLHGESTEYFSILPIEESIISIKNAMYPLDKVRIQKNDTYTTSNAPLTEHSHPIIHVHRGCVYLCVIRK